MRSPKVRQYKILEEGELTELVKKAQEGDELAMDRVVKSNLRLVWSIIHRKWGSKRKLHEDLFQIGCVGLVKAVKRFDPEKGVKFCSYAGILIEGEIKLYFRDSAYILKVPRNVSEIIPKLHRNNLTDSTPQEISTALGIPLELANEALIALERRIVKSENDIVHKDNYDKDIELKRMIDGDLNGEDWFEYVALREAMKVLSPREQQVLQGKYMRGKTQAELSKELRTSQPYVSTIEKRAINKLKEYLLQEGA